MEEDFLVGMQPLLADSTPDMLEMVDFSMLRSAASATRETHRLLFQVGILPQSFGGNFDRMPVTFQLRNDRGVNSIGVAALSNPRDALGNSASAINAFAHKYLVKNGSLAFLELGPRSGAASLPQERDPSKAYFHVVEHVRSLEGDGSVRSNGFGVMAEVTVRVYTAPALH